MFKVKNKVIRRFKRRIRKINHEKYLCIGKTYIYIVTYPTMLLIFSKRFPRKNIANNNIFLSKFLFWKNAISRQKLVGCISFQKSKTMEKKESSITLIYWFITTVFTSWFHNNFKLKVTTLWENIHILNSRVYQIYKWFASLFKNI